jgi:hypothetical protein
MRLVPLRLGRRRGEHHRRPHAAPPAQKPRGQGGVVPLTPGCQIGYMDGYIPAVINGCLRPCVRLGLSHSRGLSDWLHGLYWLSSTGCVLTHNNNVVKSANPRTRRITSPAAAFSSTSRARTTWARCCSGRGSRWRRRRAQGGRSRFGRSRTYCRAQWRTARGTGTSSETSIRRACAP